MIQDVTTRHIKYNGKGFRIPKSPQSVTLHTQSQKVSVSHSAVSSSVRPHRLYSLPGSSVHGILQERILEWVAIPFSRGSSWHGVWKLVSHICGQILYYLSHKGSPDTKCYTLRISPQSNCLITFQSLCYLSNRHFIMLWLKQLKTSMFKITSLGEIPWQSSG